MKIYTKKGDDGKTSLLGGKRVAKADLRIEAYGTVDELNSFLGLLRDQGLDEDKSQKIIQIQNNLFSIGSHLATESGSTSFPLPELNESEISFLEKEMDEMDETLPEMKNFVLPGGHVLVSSSHVCRTVCRRAERLVADLSEREEIDSYIRKYLNRLSDFLFVLSRKLAHELKVQETPWITRT